jgi:hypothetical protein
VIELYKKPKQTDATQVEGLETLLGGGLPPDYRIFLLQSNGGFSRDYEITFPDWIYPGETTLGVMTWGGVCPEKPFFNMEKSLRMIKSLIPAKMLPIAEATSNHLLLLSVRAQDHGAIYAYDPELEGDESLRKVAASFTAFCEMLRPSTSG